MKVKTRRYLMKVRVQTSAGTERAHGLICYGLDEISKVSKAIEPEQLRKFFPEVQAEDLKKTKINQITHQPSGREACAPEIESNWRPCLMGRPVRKNRRGCTPRSL